MELTDLVVLGVACAFCSGLFSLLWVFVVSYFNTNNVNNRLSRLEADISSLEGRTNGREGAIRKAEKAERMQTAMVEVAAIMKNPEIPDKQKAIMELALKYPDIALDLVKKGL